MSIDAFSPAVFPRLHGSGLNAERERARLRGYADGHAEGFRAGSAVAAVAHEQALAERVARDAEDARTLERAVAVLHAAARSLSDRERSLTAPTRTQVLERAVELAEIILAGELADAEASASASIRRAVSAVESEQVRELRLNPDDLRTLERLGALPTGFILTGDETLSRGDAVATLESGHIDARVGAALERARRAVTEHPV